MNLDPAAMGSPHLSKHIGVAGLEEVVPPRRGHDGVAKAGELVGEKRHRLRCGQGGQGLTRFPFPDQQRRLDLSVQALIGLGRTRENASSVGPKAVKQ